eukprot:768070-Hanusia_phi.AAC.5
MFPSTFGVFNPDKLEAKIGPTECYDKKWQSDSSVLCTAPAGDALSGGLRYRPRLIIEGRESLWTGGFDASINFYYVEIPLSKVSFDNFQAGYHTVLRILAIAPGQLPESSKLHLKVDGRIVFSSLSAQVATGDDGNLLVSQSDPFGRCFDKIENGTNISTCVVTNGCQHDLHRECGDNGCPLEMMWAESNVFCEILDAHLCSLEELKQSQSQLERAGCSAENDFGWWTSTGCNDAGAVTNASESNTSFVVLKWTNGILNETCNSIVYNESAANLSNHVKITYFPVCCASQRPKKDLIFKRSGGSHLPAGSIWELMVPAVVPSVAGGIQNATVEFRTTESVILYPSQVIGISPILPGQASPKSIFQIETDMYQVFVGIAGRVYTSLVITRDIYGNPRTLSPSSQTVFTINFEPQGQALLTDVGNGSLVATYMATFAGSYTLSIFCGSFHIQGSPLSSRIDASSIDIQASYTSFSTGFNQGVAGSSRDLTVVPKDTFGNTIFESMNFTALISSNTEDSMIAYQVKGNQKFIFAITRSGQYSLSIKYGGNDIGASTLLQLFPEIVDASASLILDASGGSIKDKVTFWIRSRDKYGNDAGSTTEDWKVYLQPAVATVKVSAVGNGLYAASFQTTDYAINLTASVVLRGTQHASISPFIFEIVANPGAPDASTSLITGEGDGNPAVIQTQIAGVKTIFLVILKDIKGIRLVSGGHLVTYRIDSGSLRNCTDRGDGTYIAEFILTRSSQYQIRVFLASDNIKGSPFNITYVPNITNASNCRVQGDAVSLSTAGTPASFSITSFDAFGNPVLQDGTLVTDSFEIFLRIGNDVITPAISYTSFKHICEYLVTRAGLYALHVRLLGSAVQVKGSPFNVSVWPNVPSAKASTFSLSTSPIQAGQPRLFTAFMADIYGNQNYNVTAKFEVVVTPESGSCELGTCLKIYESQPVSKAQPGLREFALYLTKSGQYLVQISLFQQSIPSSPASIRVVSSQMELEKTSFNISFINFNIVRAREQVYLMMQLKDAFENNLTSGGLSFSLQFTDSPGNVALRSSIIDLQNGTYIISWMPTLKGTYLATIYSITSNKQYSRILQFYAIPGITNLSVSTYEPTVPNTIVAGTSFTLGILAKDSDLLTKPDSFAYQRGWESLDTMVLTSSGVTSISNVSCQFLQLKYYCSPLLTRSGTYQIILYLFGSQGLLQTYPSTPWSVQVYADRASADKSTFALISTVTAGVPVSISITAKDSYGNPTIWNAFTNYDKEYSFEVKSLLETAIPCPYSSGCLQNNLDGTYTAVAIITKSDVFKIYISTYGKNLPLIPFQISVLPSFASVATTKLSIASEYLPITQGTAGVVKIFTLNLFDNYGNVIRNIGSTISFTATSIPDANGKINSISFPATALDGGIYQFPLTITVATTYTISVKVLISSVWNDVIGSPFIMKVETSTIYAPECIASGSGLRSAVKDEIATFSVQARDRYTNLIPISGIGFTAKFVGFSDTFNSIEKAPGLYEIAYVLPRTGSFVFSVALGQGCPDKVVSLCLIKDNPFSVKVLTNVGPISEQTTVITDSDFEVRSAISSDAIHVQAFDGNGLKLLNEDIQIQSVRLLFTLDSKMEYGKHLGDGLFAFFPNVTMSGTYRLSVQIQVPNLANRPILGSPFSIRVIPGPTDPTRTSVLWSTTSRFPAGTAQSFQIVPRDSMGNLQVYDIQGILGRTSDAYVLFVNAEKCPEEYTETRISCGNSQAAILPILDNQTNFLTYTIKFRALMTSSYKVSLNLNTVVIATTTFTVVSSGWDATTSVVNGPGISSSTAGVLSFITLTGYDSFGNQLEISPTVIPTAILSVVQNNSVSVDNVNLSPQVRKLGVWDISWTFTRAGKYSLRIGTFSREGTFLHCIGSPFTIDTSAAALEITNTIAIGQSLSKGKAGIQSSFYIQARDRFSNAISTGGIYFNIFFEGPPFFYPSSVQDLASTQSKTSFSPADTGQYLVGYVTTVTGNYKIHVRWGSIPIKGSPFALLVEGGQTCASLSRLIGTMLTSCTAGLAATFGILTRDAFSNVVFNEADRFTLDYTPGNVRDPNDLTILPQVQAQAICVQGSSYNLPCSTLSIVNGCPSSACGRKAAYYLTISGTYTLTVFANLEPVNRVPLAVSAKPTVFLASSTVLSGSGLADSQVGISLSVLMQLRDRFGNNLLNEQGLVRVQDVRASISYSSVAVPSFVQAFSEIFVRDLDQGRFDVTYTPTIAGSYFFSISVLNVPLLANPARLQVVSGAASAPQTQLILSSSISTAGIQGSFAIFPRDLYGNTAQKGSLTFSVYLQLSTVRSISPVVVNALIQSTGTSIQVQGTFACTISGLYRIIGSLNGIVIGTKSVSDTVLSVLAGPESFYSASVSGEGVIGTQFGSEVTFGIETKDGYGNSRVLTTPQLFNVVLKVNPADAKYQISSALVQGIQVVTYQVDM